MIPSTNESQIQINTIAHLKKMGYTYISPKEMKDYRTNTAQVLLKWGSEG